MQNDTNAPVDTQAENAQEQAGSPAGAGGYTATGVRIEYVGYDPRGWVEFKIWVGGEPVYSTQTCANVHDSITGVLRQVVIDLNDGLDVLGIGLSPRRRAA